MKFSETEREIIDSRVFQRLRRIRQLAGAHLVYPGAQHSRFEHSLGAMHVSGMAGEALLSKGYIDDAEIVEELRLGALLHDVGHGPFSHLFEEVLELRCRTTHEEIGRKIILQTEISDVLKRGGWSPEKICRLSFGQTGVSFLNEIISGSLSADIMDYLPRDAYFTGAEYGKIDLARLTGSLEVSRGKLAIDQSSYNSLESMLISRYEMFKAVYFHKTVRSAEVMLLHSMTNADPELGLTDTSLENYLSLTDEATLERLCEVQNRLASKLAKDYRDRRLLKCVYEKMLLKRDRYKKMDRKSLLGLAESIALTAGVDPSLVFVDASKAPSMPLTPSKEEMRSIRLAGKNKDAQEIPVASMPLIDSLSGFLDMLRVYTTAENREAVERSVKKVLGEQRPLYIGANN